jgi:hypothetical protein
MLERVGYWTTRKREARTYANEAERAMKNGATGGPAHGIEVVTTNATEEMEAYDQLPPELREAIGNAPVSAAATPVLKLLREGRSPEEVLAIIRRNVARIPLSFVREE